MSLPKLWGHQRTELERYGEDEARGLLWSMRTGKTRTIAEQIKKLHELAKITGVIIIAPNGVHAQWAEDQLPRWLPGLISSSLTWRSSSTKPSDVSKFIGAQGLGLSVLALNVESLQIKRVQDLIRQYLVTRDHGKQLMIVFDESHAFRRPGARRTRLARSLSKRCAYRRILTGTAALNSPLHLFSQFELLQPCALGHKTFGAFRSHYADYLTQTRRDGRSYPQLIGYRNLEELRGWVSLWASVVPRSEANVPATLTTRRLVILSSPQRRAYDLLTTDTLSEASKGAINVSKHMMKFQQILGGFIIDDCGDIINIDDNPPRLKALVDEVMGSEPCRVIVWCRFKEDIRRVCVALRKKKIEVVEYHGDVYATHRAYAIERLNDKSKGPVAFVGQPQAAGEGLDLSGASVIIWYGHTYDAIVREQASARASKVGSEPVVLVDIVAEKTLDIGILYSLAAKKQIAEDLTGEGLAALLAGAI